MKKTKQKRIGQRGSRQKTEEKFQPLSANVKVIGIGGGGGNAVARMAKDFTRGVDFIAINTDHQDLDECEVKTKLYIGKSLTRGLGTGMNPDLGRQAAEENRSEITEAVQGADLVFLAAGLGRRHRFRCDADRRGSGEAVRRAHDRGRHEAIHVRRKPARAHRERERL